MSVADRLRNKRAMLLLLIVFWIFMVFLYLVLPANRKVARRYGGMREKEYDLVGGDTVVQDFSFPFDGAQSITVFMSGEEVGEQEIDLVLEDVTAGSVLVEKKVNSGDLKPKERQEYEMPVADSAGHVFRLTVKNRGPEGQDAGANLQASNAIRSYESAAVINGRKSDITLVSLIYFSDSHVTNMYFIMWALIIAGSLICFLLLSRDHARNFLVIGLFCGMIYVFWNPYAQPIDEPAHLFRAYAVSEGHLNDEISEDGKIGAAVSENYGLYDCVWISPFNTYANSELFTETMSPEKAFFEQPYSANYIPVNYFPSAMAIAAGKLLGAGFGWLVYLARLANLITYLLFGYFAIRKVPVYRTAFFVTACLPLAVYFAGCVSIDVALNGAALYFTATCVKYIFSETETEKIGVREMLQILFSAAFIASPKFLFYTPLFLLLFFIPKEKYVKRSYQFILFASGIALVMGMLFWQLYLMRTYVFEEDRNGNVSMAGQLAHMRAHPRTALRTLVGSFIGDFMDYFGMYALFAPPAVRDAAALTVPILCVLADDGVPEGRMRERRRFMAAGILIALLVAALSVFAAYVGYTPVGADAVEGVQARYMLPVLVLLYIALSNVPAKFHGKNFELGCAFAMMLFNLGAAAYTTLYFRPFL